MSESVHSTSTIADAVIVGGVAYGERSRVVRALTRDHGMIPLWVPNATKDKGLWHPMAHVELAGLRQGKGNGLWTVKEWQRGTPQLEFRRCPQRSSVGFFIAEVLVACLEEAAQAPEVFNLSIKAVEWLESEPATSWIHVKFLSHFVWALGMMPESPHHDKLWLNLATGEFVPEEHASKTDLSAQVVHDLRNILGMDFGQMERLSWSRLRRKTLVLGVFDFVQAQLGRSRELKSYDVLEAVFA